MGASSADTNGNGDSGQSYVVFGREDGFPLNLDLSSLNGENGFILNGIAAGDVSGASVSGAGDVNGDGIDDLIVGAPNADANGNSIAGQSYVVFGREEGFPAEFTFSALNGNNGIVLNGIATFSRSGRSVSGAGDVNGDGIDDLIVGAPDAGANGNLAAGQSYVIFGGATLIGNPGLM